jgi:cell division protein FtsW
VHRKSVYFLVVAVAALIVIGCVMLFSTSAFAQDTQGNPNFYIKRQFMWLAVGFVACVVAANVDYHFWQRTWYIWFGLAIVLLALCFVPPFGARINGSARWIRAGGITFQPSELGKLAAITMLAWWFSREETDARSFLKGFVLPIGGTCILLALIAPEVDMGTTALICATMFAMMSSRAPRLRFIAPVFAAGLAACSTSPRTLVNARGGSWRSSIWRSQGRGRSAAVHGFDCIWLRGCRGAWPRNGRQKNGLTSLRAY